MCNDVCVCLDNPKSFPDWSLDGQECKKYLFRFTFDQKQLHFEIPDEVSSDHYVDVH